MWAPICAEYHAIMATDCLSVLAEPVSVLAEILLVHRAGLLRSEREPKIWQAREAILGSSSLLGRSGFMKS